MLFDDCVKDQCRQEFPRVLSMYTEKSRKGNLICTECGSGTGKNKSGAMVYYKDSQMVKCHKCGYSADVFKFWADVHNIDVKRDFRQVLNGVCNDLGITNNEPLTLKRKPIPVREEPPPNPREHELEEYTTQLARADILEAEKHLEECDYLTLRGIPVWVQRRFRCGYLPFWVHPKIKAKYGNDFSQIPDSLKSPRVIIPDGDLENPDSYTARAIRSEDEADGRKAMKTANPKVFNSGVLKSTEPQVVFLVEGAIDCMSLVTLGFKAVAIGSTAYVEKFFKECQIDQNTVIVVALDNDSAGTKATQQIIEGCRERKIVATVADMDLYGSCKDANELLQSGRELLAQNLSNMVEKANSIDKDEYIKECIKMEEIKNITVPQPVILVGENVTRRNDYPEVTYENILSDDIINHFGKLATESEVNDYYNYLLDKAREFRRYTECQATLISYKRQMNAHLKQWYNNKKNNGHIAPKDLPVWVTENRFGEYKIDEPAYCQFKVASRELRTINGEMYTIDGKIDENALRKEIALDISKYIKIDVDRKTTQLLNLLKTSTYALMSAPDIKRIHVLNGTLDLERRKFSPQKEWCLNRLNVSFKAEYRTPVKWLGFLKQLFRSEDDIKTLQEYMGYGLVPTTIAQKMLFITGNGGEGKSVIGSVYRQILGAGNSYSAHIHRLQERPCELANCVNKLVNIDDDTQFKALEDTGTVKEIITGGSLTVERKYRDPQDVTLYSRLLCFSNAPLRALYDRSEGFYRRQLIIRTKPKDKDRIDNPNLVNEIVAEELNDIFRWALDGLYRLISNNYQFTISDDSKNLLETTKKEGFNFIEYLEDTSEVTFDETSQTPSIDIYNNYENWCYVNAKEPLKKNTVLSWLKDHAHEYKIKEDCNIINPRNSRRCRGFRGMKVYTHCQCA